MNGDVPDDEVKVGRMSLRSKFSRRISSQRSPYFLVQFRYASPSSQSMILSLRGFTQRSSSHEKLVAKRHGICSSFVEFPGRLLAEL